MPPLPRFAYGVCGYPLGQSLSPALHAWAFARLGHPGAYFAWPREAEKLPAFINAVRTLPVSGLSLTIPHKQAVVPLLDGVTETARSIGAVNTLFWRDGKLLGDNTDMAGFLAPLTGRPLPSLVLVLGGGGAARAVLAGLTALGAPRVLVAVRDPAGAASLARDFSCVCSPWDRRPDILPEPGTDFWVINTTPLGMRGKAEDETPHPARAMTAAAAAAGDPARCLAYDLVYNPLRTRFLADAAARGWAVQDGLDMFAAQAAAQSGLWTGRTWDGVMMAEARVLLRGLLAERERP